MQWLKYSSYVPTDLGKRKEELKSIRKSILLLGSIKQMWDPSIKMLLELMIATPCTIHISGFLIGSI
jgi:hypothetical protein